MMYTVVIAVCLAVSLPTSNALFSSEHRLDASKTSTDDGDILVCRQEPIELGIVLDSSSSIRHRDFRKGVKFLQNFVDKYDIGEQGVRVSIVSFGRGIYPRDGFDLTTYNTKEEVKAALGRVPHRAGLYTDTGKAIEYMHKLQLSSDVVRPGAEKIGLVITDGNSQEWRFTRDAAASARDDGIVMFAVGVGRTVRDKELMNIAGNASRVTKVDNYDKLEGILETLVSKTCVKKVKPTTPPPMTQTCGQLNPSDVYFVFSPASLGRDATAWTTSFITSTISAEDMDNGFRYGVVSGSCPDDSGFDLDHYGNVPQIQQRLETYNKNRMDTLVKRILKDGYTEERGARFHSRKVAVLVVPNTPKGKEHLKTQVKTLVEQGIQVFLADPSGNGIQIQDATTLSGRSSRQQSKQLIQKLCPQNVKI